MGKMNYFVHTLEFGTKMNSSSFFEYDAFELDANIANFVYYGKIRLHKYGFQ